VWFDSHCHITADGFDEDREAAIGRAREAGVGGMVAIGAGYGLDDIAPAVALAEQDPRIFATAGVHPHDASQWDDDTREILRGWLTHERVVAVGECGLDYHYMNSPQDAQRRTFAEQVSLARELAMPVSIHVRSEDASAYDQLLDIWLAEGGGSLEGVLHCYTGELDFAHRALDAGFLVSFSGIVTFKKSEALRDVARALPLDRLMVETDAPFLAPEGHRGKRNEPAWVPRVGETLAALHGVSPEEVARLTTRNAERFYRIDGSPPATP
jgi:TatD DNase family protein